MRPILTLAIVALAACTPKVNPVTVPPVTVEAPGVDVFVAVDEGSIDKAQAMIGNPKSISAHYPIDARAAIRDAAAKIGRADGKSAAVLKVLDFSVTREVSGEGFNSTRHDIETTIAVRLDIAGHGADSAQSIPIIVRGHGTTSGFGNTHDRHVPRAIAASVADGIRKMVYEARVELAQRVR